MADDNLLTMLNDRLVDGEEVIEISGIHPGIYWQSIVVGLIAFLLWVFVAKQLGMILWIFALTLAVYAFLRRKILLFVLTNKRIFARAGLLQIEVVDIQFDRIESLELEQMPPGFFMGYSNLVVTGTGNRLIVIPYVSNGGAIRKAFSEITLK